MDQSLAERQEGGTGREERRSSQAWSLLPGATASFMESLETTAMLLLPPSRIQHGDRTGLI